MNYVNLLLNTVINSIPEEGFIFGFALYVLVKLQVLEFNKRNFCKRMLPGVIISASVSNVVRIFIADINVVLLIMSAFTVIVLFLAHKIHVKHILQVLFAVFSSIVILQATEIYIIVYLQKAGQTVKALNSSALLSFYVSLPERLIQYLIFSSIYVKRLDYFYVKFIKKQKKIMGYLLSAAFVYYCILGDLLLSNILSLDKVGLIIFTAIPLLPLWAYYCVIYINNRKSIIKEKHETMLMQAKNFAIMRRKMFE